MAVITALAEIAEVAVVASCNSLAFGTWNLELKAWKFKFGIWNLEPGAWNLEPNRSSESEPQDKDTETAFETQE